MRLFKAIEPLKEGDEVVYVGCYVLKWHDIDRSPTIGFVPASKEDLEIALRECTDE